MRRKKVHSNIKILQSQLRELAVASQKEEAKPLKKGIDEGAGIIIETVTKIKKKGVPKDELISTKRLLTV